MFAARRIAQLGKIIFKFVFISLDKWALSVREFEFGESLFGLGKK